VNHSRLTVRFGPLEHRGLLGPLDAPQLTLITAAAIAVVVLLDLAPRPGAALAGLAMITLLTAGAFAPVGGRRAIQWLPTVAGFLSRSARGRGRFRSAAPLAGHRGTPAVPARPGLGGRLLDGIAVEAIDYRSGTLGLISDRSRRRVSTVLACAVPALSLLDPADQERRLSQWGVLLTTLASGPVRRLQWIERTGPAAGHALGGWLAGARDPELGVRGSAPMESYVELISASAPVIQAHELLLCLQLDPRRVRGGPAGARLAAIEQTERVADALAAGEVTVLGALGPGQLERTLRAGFDPYLGLEPATGIREGPPDARGAGSGAAPGPMALDEHWDHVRCDGSLHATFWIAAWPRVEVPALFLSGLLHRAQNARAVAVTFEPVAADRSTREVEAAVTRDEADRTLRRRFGQSETARHRQAQESALRREAELAAGHGEVRFSGFITVSGRDEGELRRGCAETIQQAAAAHLELRRVYGRQAEAFTFTLPLARGLA
jgi:hypothetical protein